MVKDEISHSKKSSKVESTKYILPKKVSEKIEKYIQKVEKKYINNPEKAKKHFVTLVEKFKKVSEKKPKYKNIIEGINDMLQEKINTY